MASNIILPLPSCKDCPAPAVWPLGPVQPAGWDEALVGHEFGDLMLPLYLTLPGDLPSVLVALARAFRGWIQEKGSGWGLPGQSTSSQMSKC